MESVTGLSPAIAIEQRTTVSHPRSTVGTVTEIYDHLRVLFAALGRPHCPRCGEPITAQTAEQMADRAPGQRRRAPRRGAGAGRARPQGRLPARSWQAAARRGLAPRARGRRRVDLDEPLPLDPRRNHRIEVLVDRLVLRPAARSSACVAGLEKALDLADGVVLVVHRGRTRAAAQPRAWPACAATSRCPSSRRAPSPSTAPTAPAPPATAWAALGGRPRSGSSRTRAVAARRGHPPLAAPRAAPRARGARGRGRPPRLLAGRAGARAVPQGRGRCCWRATATASRACCPTCGAARRSSLAQWRRGRASRGRRRGLRGPAALPDRGRLPGLRGARLRAGEPGRAPGRALHRGLRPAPRRPRRGRASRDPPSRSASGRWRIGCCDEIRERLRFLERGRRRLPEPRPPHHHPLRRRGAPHPPGRADRRAHAGRPLRAGRAVGGPAPARQRAPARDAQGASATWATRWWWSSTTRRRSAPPTTSSTWARARARLGGRLMYQGPPASLDGSLTGRYLRGELTIPVPAGAPRRARARCASSARASTTCATSTCRIPLGVLTAVTGRQRLRQVDPGGRHPAPRAGRAACAARRRARPTPRARGRGGDRQGHRHRPEPDRPHAAQQPRHLHRRLRVHPRAVQPGARGARARLQAAAASPST